MKHKTPKIPGRHIYTSDEIRKLKTSIQKTAQGVLASLHGDQDASMIGIRDLEPDLYMLKTMERVNRHAERGDSRDKMLMHAKDMCVRFASESPARALAWSAVVQWIWLNPDLPDGPQNAD